MQGGLLARRQPELVGQCSDGRGARATQLTGLQPADGPDAQPGPRGQLILGEQGPFPVSPREGPDA